MTDEFWTEEDDAEIVHAERDDAAAEQEAGSQFPNGWEEIGATEEGVFARSRRTAAEFVEKMKPLIDAFASATIAFDTAATSHAAWKREMLEEIYGVPSHRRQVMLMGTGYRRHMHPGPWEIRLRRGMNEGYGRAVGATKRVEHARARRLYSERLRRDRRRKRAGKTPILRSSAFHALIPRAQVNPKLAGDELVGMEIVASPYVPEDTVYIVDPSVYDQFQVEPPKMFDMSTPTGRRGYTPTHWIFDEPFKINPGDIS